MQKKNKHVLSIKSGAKGEETKSQIEERKSAAKRKAARESPSKEGFLKGFMDPNRWK